MRFICMGYYDEEAFAAMSETEQHRFMDDCLSYDDELRRRGPIGGEALGPNRSTRTLRLRNGKVSVTDGPFTESKEQIGGFFTFEAKDMDEAVQLISKHPGLRSGPFEIRPVEDMTEIIRESERRRSGKGI
jgi:hypothetical protein